MSFSTIEIINQCKHEAQAHMQTAAFFRSIGAYQLMIEHMHTAMDWAVHIDLLRQIDITETPLWVAA